MKEIHDRVSRVAREMRVRLCRDVELSGGGPVCGSSRCETDERPFFIGASENARWPPMRRNEIDDDGDGDFLLILISVAT